jgi:hypothetical protein
VAGVLGATGALCAVLVRRDRRGGLIREYSQVGEVTGYSAPTGFLSGRDELTNGRHNAAGDGV